MASSRENDDNSTYSGGWTDEEQENDMQRGCYNAEMAERRQIMDHRLAVNDWCTCGSCWPPGFAASVFDLKCCQENSKITNLCCKEGESSYNCITAHPGFHYYCLEPHYLENAYHLYRIADHDDRRTDRNTRMRYTAFKSFTTWVYGKLGRHNRVEIPMCATKLIRSHFPAADGDYSGFQVVELAELEL